MEKETNRYLFSLHIQPRLKGHCSLKASDVTKLLGTTPTEVDPKGSWANDTNAWLWTFALDWIDTGGCIGDITEELLSFLEAFSLKEEVWNILSEECDYYLYIPLERDYFLIEFELDHRALYQLGIRKMRVEFSALSD